MLSDEEKQALRNFKSEYETCDHYSSDLIIELDDAEIILNLIEKQSKEIEESEQKERNAYIKGTNDAHELCNKMWKDKIKAKIEVLEKLQKEFPNNDEIRIKIIAYKELLEKE